MYLGGSESAPSPAFCQPQICGGGRGGAAVVEPTGKQKQTNVSWLFRFESRIVCHSHQIKSAGRVGTWGRMDDEEEGVDGTE